MITADVCYLITEGTGARGIFDTPDRVERKVFCQVLSVSRSEYYNAHNAGMEPEYVLKLTRDKEYQGELSVRFREKNYTVIRTYVTGDGGIELTIQRSDVN